MKTLIAQREQIDAELVAIVTTNAPLKGTTATSGKRKQVTCGKCGQPGHNAATCPVTTEEQPSLTS